MVLYWCSVVHTNEAGCLQGCWVESDEHPQTYSLLCVTADINSLCSSLLLYQPVKSWVNGAESHRPLAYSPVTDVPLPVLTTLLSVIVLNKLLNNSHSRTAGSDFCTLIQLHDYVIIRYNYSSIISLTIFIDNKTVTPQCELNH